MGSTKVGPLKKEVKTKNSTRIINFNKSRDYTVIIHIDRKFSMVVRLALQVESIVGVYQVYKTEWTPEIGDKFEIETEEGNCSDKML